MNTNIRETVRIIIAVAVFLFAASCVYDATVHSKFTYALPTTQSNSDIYEPPHQQQQQRLRPALRAVFAGAGSKTRP